MDSFIKAKEVLREFLANNKDKVIADLELMRKRSTGNDIFSYLDNVRQMEKLFKIDEVYTVEQLRKIAINYNFDCIQIGKSLSILTESDKFVFDVIQYGDEVICKLNDSRI